MKDTTNGAEMIPVSHINQIQLARRWSISARTLEHWRWEGIGPAYIKLGRRVVYSIADVEEFERRQRQGNKPPVVPAYLAKPTRR